MECWGRNQGNDKGRSIYLRLEKSRTHWIALLNPCSLAMLTMSRHAKAVDLLWESIYDTGERRPDVLIALQPQAHKWTSIRSQELVCGRHKPRLNSIRTMDTSHEMLLLSSEGCD